MCTCNKTPTASCQWVNRRSCLMWLRYTPHSQPTTKLALNVWPAYMPVWLAARVRRWGHNNGLIWVKWPVLALWWCAVPSQRDSLAYLACIAPWQLTGICCDWCRRDKKKVGQRRTGCFYLCEPVSGGGSWGAEEQGKQHRVCADLHRPVLGTFRALHLQREQNGGNRFVRVFLTAQMTQTHTHTQKKLQPFLWLWCSKATQIKCYIFVRHLQCFLPLISCFGGANSWHFSSDSTTISSRSWQEGLYQEPQ